MVELDEKLVREFLTTLGRHQSENVKLYLIGGGGLLLLGSQRRTIDIDFVSSEPSSRKILDSLNELAHTMGISIEQVPLDEFVPVEPNEGERHIFLNRFGNLEVYLYDPYAIAVSKLDRGFDTDLLDIKFLIDSRTIDIESLKTNVGHAILRASEFDLDSQAILARLAEVLKML